MRRPAVCSVYKKVRVGRVDHRMIELGGVDDSCTYHAIIKLVISIFDKR
jgi:hypothetical protein